MEKGRWNTLNITYISKSVIPSRSANSVQVMKMCQAFANAGHHVTLFSRKNMSNIPVEDSYEVYGIDTHFSIINEPFFLYQKNKKYKLPKLPLPDLIYGRDDTYSLLKACLLGRPVILEVHQPPRNNIEKKEISLLIKSKNFRRLVTISKALRNKYLHLYPQLDKKKILVAYDAADLPKVANVARDELTLLGRNQKPSIGYIGHLYPGKGMEVIQQVAELLPDLDFHIVGGTEEDLSYWRDRAPMKNILYYGYIPHGSLSPYYQAFDIVLAPYQHNVGTFSGRGNISKWMSPLKIFEYMSYSKAMIVSDLPVLQEVLTPYHDCLLCPPESPYAWADAIMRLVNNPDLRKHLEKNTYKKFAKYFTWEKRVNKVIGDVSI